VSRFSAVVKIGRIEQAGFIAWLAWLLLHLIYLVGFKSKVTTLVSWGATFLTLGRSQLTITERQTLPHRPSAPTDSAAEAA
jgi:NADH:ubiquinone reductase (H+-translocating)